MDIPLLQDSDSNTSSGFYVAACGYNQNWDGTLLLQSNDGGSTWFQIATIDTPATIGYAINSIPEYVDNTIDNLNYLDVLVQEGFELYSISYDALINGGNLAVYGNEIMQFRYATLIGTDLYRLSGLLRNRRGTFGSGHAIGDRFVLVNPASLVRINSPTTDIGVQRNYKAVTFGKSIETAPVKIFTNTGSGNKPYSVVLLDGGRDAAGNILIRWVRRTRVGGAWRDYVDAQLSEYDERYTVAIYDGILLVRTIATTSQQTTYTIAEQETDFGSPAPATIDVVVKQISETVGPGYETRGTI